MTTRTLTFKASEGTRDNPSDEQKRFALLVNMFINGGNLLHYDARTGLQSSRKGEDKRTEAKFVRGYKAISDPQHDDAGRPNGQFVLKPEGGSITMEQKPTFELLERYIDAAPGGTQEADKIVDLLDWVGAAERHDD